MLSLHDCEWKEFSISELFEISPGKRLTKSDMQPGSKPFIGATDSNNGITAFVSNTNASEDADVLGVNYNGSVVENFYHPYTCIFSDDVKRFRLKAVQGNKYLYLFLKTVILQQKKKYAYGYKFNEQRMQKQMLLLPVDDEGQPDYAFMEEYIREREKHLIEQYIAHIGAVLPPPGIIPLHKKEWKEFRITDFFSIVKGNQNNMAELQTGTLPLISAKKVDNGCKGFFAANGKTVFMGHCLTINNDGDGGAGISYFQPSNMLLDTHVTALYPRLPITDYAMQFISTCITVQHEKFGHGYSLNNARLSVFRMMLPVDSNNQPDWDYMEHYSKMLTAKLKLQYLQSKQAL